MPEICCKKISHYSSLIWKIGEIKSYSFQIFNGGYNQIMKICNLGQSDEIDANCEGCLSCKSNIQEPVMKHIFRCYRVITEKYQKFLIASIGRAKWWFDPVHSPVQNASISIKIAILRANRATFITQLSFTKLPRKLLTKGQNDYRRELKNSKHYFFSSIREKKYEE